TSRSTRWLPMKPVAPVTITLAPRRVALSMGRYWPPILLRVERNFSKIAFGGGAGMLRVYLKADALDARGGPVKGLLIILRQIVRFRHPLVEFIPAGSADHGDDMDQRHGTRALKRSLWRRRVPDVAEHAAVRKGDEDLSRLIVRRRATEIAGRGQLTHF